MIEKKSSRLFYSLFFTFTLFTSASAISSNFMEFDYSDPLIPQAEAAICPDGYTFVNGNCQIPADCPAPGQLVDGKCLYEPTNECPDGSDPVGDTCVADPIAGTCGEGFDFNSSTDKCEGDKVPRCPTGTEQVLDIAGVAFCEGPQPSDCPDGTTITGVVCWGDPILQCPPGTTPTRLLPRLLPTVNEVLNEDLIGAGLPDDVNALTQQPPAGPLVCASDGVFECPPGTMPIVNDELLGLSEDELPIEYRWLDRSTLGNLICIGPPKVIETCTDGADPILGICVRFPGSGACPPGYENVLGVCTGFPLGNSCPPDAPLNVVTENCEVTPLHYCTTIRGGVLFAGQCLREENRNCPSGSHRDGDLCVRTAGTLCTLDPIFDPADDRCERVAGATRTCDLGGRDLVNCEKDRHEVYSACARAGYTGWDAFTDQCTRSAFDPVCPSGVRDIIGTCVTAFPGCDSGFSRSGVDNCRRDNVCPSGFSDNGVVCFRPHVLSCPSGFNRDGNQCWTPACPSGFTAGDILGVGRCTQTVAPDCSFHSSYSFDSSDNRCESNQICPPGTTAINSDTLCVQFDPTITCPTNHVFVGGFCVRAIPENELCESGEFAVTGSCVETQCPLTTVAFFNFDVNGDFPNPFDGLTPDELVCLGFPDPLTFCGADVTTGTPPSAWIPDPIINRCLIPADSASCPDSESEFVGVNTDTVFGSTGGFCYGGLSGGDLCPGAEHGIIPFFDGQGNLCRGIQPDLCPLGSVMIGTTDQCERLASGQTSCPDGFIPQSDGSCEVEPDRCNEGQVYNSDTQKCESQACPSGTLAFGLFCLAQATPGTDVGGSFIPVDSTMLLVVGIQATALMWLPPVIVAGAGIAIYKLKLKK